MAPERGQAIVGGSTIYPDATVNRQAEQCIAKPPTCRSDWAIITRRRHAVMAGSIQLTHRWLAALLAGALVWGVFAAYTAGSESRRAVVIELDGAIGPGAAGYVLRSLREAQQQDAAVIVLRLDTPGGLDSAM